MKSLKTMVVATIWLMVFAASACATLLETNISSHFIVPRRIQIYLPPSYESEPQRRYPVLYLHDGQNVFSSAGTNASFGWGNWQLDTTANELARTGKMREIIMIAVDNGPERRGEYGGIHHAPEGPATNSAFENYSAFLISELKPLMDRDFRTLSDPADTAVLGSSVGGLCSVALAWDHPEVFGGAASMSGTDIAEQTNFLNQVLKPYHGPPKPFRLYLDSGVVDFSGGDDGRALTGQIAAEFQRIGWTTNQFEHFVDAPPLTTGQLEQTGLRRDKWMEAQKNQHNEFYWRLRAWRALTFLFPPETAKSG